MAEKSKALQKAREAREAKRKLMLAPSKSFITSKQLLHMLQRTPPEHIHRRKGKGGGEFEYVTGVYMKKVLNYVFGWMWDFKVIDKPSIQEVIMLIEKNIKQIWVYGELTVKDNKGHSITKGQAGRADIKFYKDRSKGALDIGNDLKAAITDCLKKCASEFGIASDVYGRTEFKEIDRDKEVIKEEFVKPEKVQKKDLVKFTLDKIKKEDDDNILYKMMLKIIAVKTGTLLSQTAKDMLVKAIRDKLGLGE